MTGTAHDAMAAWQSGRRRRLASRIGDVFADGALAAGGTFLVNSTVPLSIGLPAGRAGATVGAALLCAGLAWLCSRRRTAAPPARAGGLRTAPPLGAQRAA